MVPAGRLLCAAPGRTPARAASTPLVETALFPQDIGRRGADNQGRRKLVEFQDIIYQKKDGVATITINRPHVYNAFRNQTIQEMVRALEDADEDGTAGGVGVGGGGGEESG